MGFCNSLYRIKKERITPLSSAVGEAIASKPMLNTNCGGPWVEHQQWKKDSAHLDGKMGIGTFDRLKKNHLTDKTQIN